LFYPKVIKWGIKLEKRRGIEAFEGVQLASHISKAALLLRKDNERDGAL
jgi:hypothetical protein